MMKLKKLIINNKELLFGIVIGLMLSSTAVFAVIKYSSTYVFYRNTSSHLNATNVQAAIDELYTTCTSRAYTLTADSKGGTIPTTAGWSISGSTATKPVIFNSEYGTLPIPTKGGHTFVGWFTKESGGTQIISSTKYRIAGDSTIHAHWNADTYTATFYYQSNTASGGATVASKTASCTVSSGSSCTVDIPTEVINSGGAYNNKYVGLSTSTGNMTEGVSGSATTVTLSANTNYYSLYRTAIILAYPTSESAATTKTVYQNQWFTSNTAMATTVLSTTTTGTSNNATIGSLVSGYSLVGFDASASINTATWTTLDGVKQSNSSKASTRTVYQIETKEETISAKFYYNDNTACGGTTIKNTNEDVERITYLRCTSTTEADTSVNTGELSIPSVVTSSKGPYNGTYVNVASSVNSMTPATVNVSTLTYYAFYRSEVTRYYAATATTASNDTLYRNEVFTSTTAMKTVLSTTNTGTTTNVTPRLAVSGYDTLVGFNTSSSKNVANSGETIAELTTTCNNSVFEIDKKTESISATFYYSSSSDGTKANDSFSGTRTTFLRPTGSTAAGTSISQGTIDLSGLSSTAPYGTSQLGWGYNANSMSTTTVNTSRTAFYAIYQKSGIRINYYDGSAYTTRTDIYRNGIYSSGEKYTMVLSASATGSGNYSTAGGPNGSTWNGLSTGADSTPEYSTVSAAALSSTTTFYTVYKYLVNYNKGVNVSNIDSVLDSCNINSTGTSSGTSSCTVTLPTITPNQNYTSIGWNTTGGATTGSSPGNSYSLNASPTSLYANAYPAVTYNAGETCTGATGMPSSQVKLPEDNLTLQSETPTCSGKAFLGWATTSLADENSSWYDPLDDYTTEAPLTLYAQFYNVNSLERSYTYFVQSGDFNYVGTDNIGGEMEDSMYGCMLTYGELWGYSIPSGYNDADVLMGYMNLPYRVMHVASSAQESQSMWGKKVIMSASTSSSNTRLYKMLLKSRSIQTYTGDIDTRIDRLQKLSDVGVTYDDIKTVGKTQDNIVIQPGNNPSTITNDVDSGYEFVSNAGFNVTNASENGINMSRVYVSGNYFENITGGRRNKMILYDADIPSSTTPARIKLTTYFVESKLKTVRNTTFSPGDNKGLTRYNALKTLNNTKSNYITINNFKIFTANGSNTSTGAWGNGTATKNISIPDGKILGVVEHGVRDAENIGSNGNYASINRAIVTGMNTTSGSLSMSFYGANNNNSTNVGTAMTNVYGFGRIIYISSGSMQAS